MLKNRKFQILVVIALIGIAQASDTFLRHPELRPRNAAADTSDYFLRHSK